jgi:hypothetical protein
MTAAVRYPVAYVLPRPIRSDAATVKISVAADLRQQVSQNKTGKYFRIVEFYHRDFRNCDNDIGTYRAALLTRVYVDAPPFTPPPAFHEVMDVAGRRLGKQLPESYNDSEIQDSLRKFPPRKRERYSEALKTPWTEKDADVTGFTKDEYCEVKPNKFFKPRAIQFRNPKFLAHSLEFFEPIEHGFYRGKYLFNRYQKYTCAKGANPHNRIGYIRRLVSELQACHVIGLDGTAFDAHVVAKALKAEWKFYDTAAKSAGWSRKLRRKMKRMGRCQLRNKCRARVKDGFIRYTVEGNRMSGDKNTGLGNSVLQSGYIASAMVAAGVPESGWRMYVDGDDALLFVAGIYLPLLYARMPSGKTVLEEHFESCSQEMKMAEPKPVDVDHLEAIEFCQARPVCVNGFWRLIRDPKKVMNTYLRSKSWFNTRELAERYFSSICPPEMILSGDVPILDKFFRELYKCAKGPPIDSVAHNYWRRTVTTSILASHQATGIVTHATRLSFERAFGISPFEQEFVEGQIGTDHILKTFSELDSWGKPDHLTYVLDPQLSTF